MPRLRDAIHSRCCFRVYTRDSETKQKAPDVSTIDKETEEDAESKKETGEQLGADGGEKLETEEDAESKKETGEQSKIAEDADVLNAENHVADEDGAAAIDDLSTAAIEGPGDPPTSEESSVELDADAESANNSFASKRCCEVFCHTLDHSRVLSVQTRAYAYA